MSDQQPQLPAHPFRGNGERCDRVGCGRSRRALIHSTYMRGYDERHHKPERPPSRIKMGSVDDMISEGSPVENLEPENPASGQDLTRCCVCGMPLQEHIGLGQMIAHAVCREYVLAVTREATERAVSAQALVEHRLRSALEAMVEAFGKGFHAARCQNANALAIRTLAELYSEEWHNRMPAERRETPDV